MEPHDTGEKLPSEPKANILLVDDRPENLLALEAILADMGVNQAKAHSGKEALRLLLENEFDLVLLDVQMDGLDGFETAKLIRSQAKTYSTPIIFLTAYDTDRLQLEQGYSLGAVDFLMKPLLPVILRAKVTALVQLFQEKKHARRLAEQYRGLVEGVKDYAIFMLDPEGRVVTWNAGAEHINGYHADEIISQHFSRFYPAEDVQSGKPAMELEVARTQGKYEEEGWRVRKDGTKFWASVVITALRDSKGLLQGFTKVTRDITDRKHAEENARRLLQEETARQSAEKYAEEIQEQREQLRVTLHSIGDGVISTDAGGRVTLLNPIAEKLTGWTNDEATGLPLQAIFHIVNETTRQPVENPVDVVLATGRIVGLANHTILIARDGTERPIDDSAAPIRRQDGSDTGVVLVFRDVTERRRAEKSARFLASIVESSEDAIIGKDVNGIITSWNRAAERLFGYSADEIVGKSVDILAPPNHDHEMPSILKRIKREERVEHFDTVRRAKDGRIVPVSLTVSPIKDEHGQIVGASKIARDISERKRAEEALREEKARLHATLIGIGDAVIVTDAESRVTMMNPVAQTLTGWKDEATGQPLEEVFRIINEYSRQPVENPVSRVIREGRIVGLANHTVLLAKDGTEIPIDDSGAPVRNSAGEIIAVVLVFRDITERKQAEKQLHQNEGAFRFLAEASSNLASVVDYASTLQKVARLAVPFFADCCIVDMVESDGSLRRLAATYLDEKKGQLSEELHRRYVPGPNDLHGSYLVLRTGESEMVSEIPDDALVMVARDEEHLRILRQLGMKSYMCVPIQASDKRIGILTFISAESGRRYGPADLRLAEDLAQRAAVAIENAHLYGELKEADRRKDEFLATLAHELRNPLTPICNAVELIRHAGGKSALIEQSSKVMERQVDQLVHLIDDLLDMSRISQGKVQLRKERLELATVIGSSVEATRSLIDAQAHELIITMPSQPIFLDADPTRLAQVMSNLLNNAAKYTEKGGRIWLTAERQGGEAVVSVRDTGIGIDAKHLSHLFEMFSQVAPALERSQGGLGIGLALVRALVELHGGSVEARSGGIGKGSEFIVRMPVVDAPVLETTKESAEDQAMSRTPKRRILFVDDNRDTANTLAMLLQSKGHETRTAFDGLEAVEIAASFQPSVIFLDIGLPRMNGYEAARHIRQQAWGTEITLIAVSGWGQEQDKKRALEAGFDHHLTKPVKAAELENLLTIITPKSRQ